MAKKTAWPGRKDWYFDNHRIMHWDQESVWNKQTNKQSKCSLSMANHCKNLNNNNNNNQYMNLNQNQNHYWFWLDQREWKKHLWMKSNQSNNQYSKLISIEHTGMDDHTKHQVCWHFEDLEYLNNINIQYSEILSNVTERGQ